MNFYQVAAGYKDVDLEEIFLKINIALIGPGKLGDFFDNKKKYKEESPSKDFQYLKAFCETVNIGDVFVLRKAINPGKQEWEIIAAGKVISPYRYEPIFYNVDVDDWNIPHCRRVLWKKPKKQIIKSGGVPGRCTPINNDDAEFIKAAKEILNIK